MDSACLLRITAQYSAMLDASTQVDARQVAQPVMRASALPQLRLEPLVAQLEKVIKRSDLGAAHVRTLAVAKPV